MFWLLFSQVSAKWMLPQGMRLNQNVIILPERLKTEDQEALCWSHCLQGWSGPLSKWECQNSGKTYYLSKTERRRRDTALKPPPWIYCSWRLKPSLPSWMRSRWEGSYQSCGVSLTHGSFCSHIRVTYLSSQSHCRGVWEIPEEPTVSHFLIAWTDSRNGELLHQNETFLSLL